MGKSSSAARVAIRLVGHGENPKGRADPDADDANASNDETERPLALPRILELRRHGVGRWSRGRGDACGRRAARRLGSARSKIDRSVLAFGERDPD